MNQPVPNAAYLAPAVWTFSFALAALGVFAVQLGLGWRGGIRASTLVIVVALSALCAAAGLAYALSRSDLAWALWRFGDITRAAGWSLFLVLLLRARGSAAAPERARQGLRIAVAGAIAGILLGVMGFLTADGAESLGTSWVRAGYAVSLALAICGLVCVEQLLRNVPPALRWGIKPLCIGLGGVFILDLFMYAEAVLFGQLDAATWSAHGALQAFLIPFIAVATARNKDWTIDVAVSRQVVFHTTALLGCSLYLLGVAAIGYYVRYFGGSWGAVAYVTLLFAAVVLLGVLVTSGTLRSKLRVLVAKHFFSYRYDYREEWLRVTNLLAQDDPQSNIYERVVKALANLVESPAGAVWVRHEAVFRQTARWNAPSIEDIEPATGSLALFLQRTGWVIDLHEWRRTPARYAGLVASDWLARWSDAWLVIPLIVRDRLIGIVVLANSRVKVDLDWEVRDLLKTAASQAASYLGQIAANEALLETEKFAAFNRMSAFVVHDLKNLVAQLALLLKNAERHRDDPEFQRDMLDTVRHVSERMNRLLAQLRVGTSPVENAKHVNLTALVERIKQAKSSLRTGLTLQAEERVYAVGHEDRLEHVIGHLVQNAIDATAADGTVIVRVAREQEYAVVEIVDDGVGMNAEFIRTRLFKPFQTTKSDGMGIGVYESYQYVTGLGGAITVESQPQRGTRLRLALPQPESALREVA